MKISFSGLQHDPKLCFQVPKIQRELLCLKCDQQPLADQIAVIFIILEKCHSAEVIAWTVHHAEVLVVDLGAVLHAEKGKVGVDLIAVAADRGVEPERALVFVEDAVVVVIIGDDLLGFGADPLAALGQDDRDCIVDGLWLERAGVPLLKELVGRLNKGFYQILTQFVQFIVKLLNGSRIAGCRILKDP